MADEGAFVPAGFYPPPGLAAGELRLEPLGPQHNERDYAAWTSSMDHIHRSPGYAGRSWPHEMSPAENLADLERHAHEFVERSGFTYTVLDETDDVVGCVYIYPCDDGVHDAIVLSWVRESQALKDGDSRRVVAEWPTSDAWPFARSGAHPYGLVAARPPRARRSRRRALSPFILVVSVQRGRGCRLDQRLRQRRRVAEAAGARSDVLPTNSRTPRAGSVPALGPPPPALVRLHQGRTTDAESQQLPHAGGPPSGVASLMRNAVEASTNARASAQSDPPRSAQPAVPSSGVERRPPLRRFTRRRILTQSQVRKSAAGRAGTRARAEGPRGCDG